MGRRDAVMRAGAAAVLLGSQALAPVAAFAATKVPGGFTAVKDSQKGYAFAYPVGWQASRSAAARGADDMFPPVRKMATVR